MQENDFFFFFSIIADPNIGKLGTIVKVSKRAFRIGVTHFLIPPGLRDMVVLARETKKEHTEPIMGSLHAAASPCMAF